MKMLVLQNTENQRGINLTAANLSHEQLQNIVTKIRDNSQKGTLTQSATLIDPLLTKETSSENSLQANEDTPNKFSSDQLTPKKLLISIKESEENEDIKLLQGAKGMYFISELYMTSEYANMLIKLEEGDNPSLMAEIVRRDCKKYPRPTNINLFHKFPFFMNKQEIEDILSDMQKHPDFQDIKSVTSFNGVKYLYSEQHMNERYAAKLADNIEYRLKG